MPQRSARTGAPRKPITTKLTDDLRAQLEAAAEANCRTLSSEIEFRLRASFAVKPVLKLHATDAA